VSLRQFKDSAENPGSVKASSKTSAAKAVGRWFPEGRFMGANIPEKKRVAIQTFWN